jgi:hypothetical protein
VGRILELAGKGQWDEWARLFHDDLVIEWPQSGERIEGRDTAVDFHSNLPEGGVDMTLLNVRGGYDVVISEVKSQYPDGSTWYWTNIYEFKDGKVGRVTGYFAETFEAPEWRAKWVTKA